MSKYSELVMGISSLLFLLSEGCLGRLFDLNLRDFERVLGVFLNKGNKALQGAVTLVVDEFLGTGRLELQGGEASNPEWNGRRKVVLRGVELGTVMNVSKVIDVVHEKMAYMMSLSLMAAYFSPSCSQVGARRLQ